MTADLITRARAAETDDTIPGWVSCDMRRRIADREAEARRGRAWAAVSLMREREAAGQTGGEG